MALRELLAYFKIDVQTGALTRANKQISQTKQQTQGLFSLLRGARAAFSAFAVGLGARQLAIFTTEVLDTAAAMGKLADRTDLTLEEFQAWEALGSSVGVRAEQTAEAIADFADRIEDFAKRGAGEGADAFQELGIELEGTDGRLRKSTDVLVDFVVGLNEMEDQTAATGLAVRAMGDSGQKLLPALQGSREEIEANLRRAEEYGVVMGREFPEQARAAKQELFFFQRQLLGIRVQLVRLFLPALRETVVRATEVSRAVAAWAKTHRVQLGNALRAGVATGFLGTLLQIIKRYGGIQGVIRTLMPWVNRLFVAFARFIIPFLIIDDFFAFLEGRKSVIGTILEEFGLVDDAEKSGKELRKVIESWIPALKKFAANATRFFTEVGIAFGALVGMFSSDNDEMASDFEDVFSRNTNTINDFFDWLFARVPTGWSVWQATIGRFWQFLVGVLSAATLTLLDWFRTIGNSVVSTFSRAVQTVGGWISWFVSFVDALFGTNLAGAVDSATANIVSGFQSAWDQATQGIDAIENAVRSVGASIKNLITDPIGEAAKIITGSTEEKFRQDIAAVNEQNIAAARARAAQRRAETAQPRAATAPATTRNVTLTDRSTTTIQVPAQAQPGAVGRAVATAVERTQTTNRRRTLAAVR